MSGKTFFIDLTKCTACRGCQVACKQWKKLPAEQTENWGSHQNPKDLSHITLKLVRFSEVEIDGQLNWLFTPEQCRHCVEAPCIDSGEVEGSMIHDPDTGAVVYTPLTAKEDGEAIRQSCPYDIPRVDPETGVVAKCDMCNDRVKMGMLPACVKVCPTGAMNFGDREEMLKLAEASLAKAQEKYPDAELIDPDEVRVVYLTAYGADNYYEYLSSDASSVIRPPLSRKQFLAKMGSPLRKIVSG